MAGCSSEYIAAERDSAETAMIFIIFRNENQSTLLQLAHIDAGEAEGDELKLQNAAIEVGEETKPGSAASSKTSYRRTVEVLKRILAAAAVSAAAAA
jgi:hypothetical protein